jgi:type II secretory pathway component PulF
VPYFKWVGVDIVGNIKKGKSAALSSPELSAFLLHHEIAVLRSKPVKTMRWLWPITTQLKADIFTKIIRLLRAGVLLPQALQVIAEQSSHPIVHDIFFSIKSDMNHGVPINKALQKHSCLYDSMVAVMLQAGHESGNILQAMEHVALYFERKHTFHKNMKTTLAMPLLTLLFFLGISLFIFVFIVPRFAEILRSINQQLPPLTKGIVAISEFVCSFSMVYLGVVLAVIVTCLYQYTKTPFGKNFCHRLLYKLPGIGAIAWQYSMCQALQALALLITSGVPLVQSLDVVAQSIDNSVVADELRVVYHTVQEGSLLSKAMLHAGVFLPEVIALVHVGEESGTIGMSLEDAAAVYYALLEHMIKKTVFFLQPLLIVLLGLLVMILIFAVYAPIMQLSYTI